MKSIDDEIMEVFNATYVNVGTLESRFRRLSPYEIIWFMTANSKVVVSERTSVCEIARSPSKLFMSRFAVA